MIDVLKHTSEVFNEDCMVGMSRYPDKYFDLAVVDPPYGLGAKGFVPTAKTKVNGKYCLKKFKAIDAGGNYSTDLGGRPSEKYFEEIQRVSRNQIIWGMQYFAYMLPQNQCVIIWDKHRIDGLRFSEAELAWTSYDSAVRFVKLTNIEMLHHRNNRIHPTQKPVALYDWIYKNYLPNGGKVIDTHLGSGSNRIAANRAGNIDFTGFELDKDYYEAQEKRWKAFISQTRLF